MKRLTLVKTCHNIPLAHLYEHLFCYALEQFFLDNRLISYLDYHYDAKTYHGGFLHLVLDAFTPEAEKLLAEVELIKPSFDLNSFNTAVLEIMAEKQITLSLDTEKAVRLLCDLQDEPWKNISEVGIYAAAKIRRSSHAFKSYDASATDFRTMTCRIELVPGAQRPAEGLIPLAYVIYQAISNSLTDLLARRYAYHGSDIEWKLSESQVVCARKYRVHRRQIKQLTTETKDCEALLWALVQNGFEKKLLAYLQSANYDVLMEAPDELTLYEKSQLLVGGQGWRETATEQNIKDIMANTHLSFTLGRQKITAALLP